MRRVRCGQGLHCNCAASRPRLQPGQHTASMDPRDAASDAQGRVDGEDSDGEPVAKSLQALRAVPKLLVSKVCEDAAAPGRGASLWLAGAGCHGVHSSLGEGDGKGLPYNLWPQKWAC
jgi:hypothetical protein